MTSKNNIIEVKNLNIQFNLKQGKNIKTLRAVDNVSLNIKQGEMLGIIGESGSGKSTLAFGILNLIETPGKILSGDVHYLGQTNLLTLSDDEQKKYRWKEIATVFQAAQSALNPIITVEDHFYDTLEAHTKTKINYEKAREEIISLLDYVRLDKKVLKMYPFELSGGMKQRVLIALSLLLNPKLIILDEPTTALDVITQWYILEILYKINKEKGITIVFLTHDISVICSIVDRIAVMYAGQIVEIAETKTIYNTPSHPYTKALLRAVPTLDEEFENRSSIRGATYNMLNPDSKCRFMSRCNDLGKFNCTGENIVMTEIREGQLSLCPFGIRVGDND